MPDSPHKLSQFWQELKRRKVMRIITVYAAAAFVILELIDIVAPSLGLPEWTMNFIIVLLCVGFIIAVILSWIYDIHPEGGIVKTEPLEKIKAEDIPKSSKSWKVASYISFVVIVALIVLNIIPRTKRSDIKEILDKSIAVLPFINDSPDEENTYFINGTMEAILDNLCKIEDLRVVGRTSVEQYRNAPKPIPVIAKEMNVSYILEGSGQKDGNKVRLTLQLIDGINDQHLWSSPYIREIEMGQIFDLQSEIAELVAGEIKALITPKEKQLIEKIPTTNLTAYDFYLRGRAEHEKYWLDSDHREALERAEDLYHKALEYDSAFALAYTGLGYVYWTKYYWETYLSENFLDSVLIWADIALSYDNKLSEAYSLKGRYYIEFGESELAVKEFDRAIQLNPNDWEAYRGLGMFYDQYDLVKSINNYSKAILLHRGSGLPGLLRGMVRTLLNAGFTEKAEYYSREAMKLDGDSVNYFYNSGLIEIWKANYVKSIELLIKAYAIDSMKSLIFYRLGEANIMLGRNEESLEFYLRWFERQEPSEAFNIYGLYRLAYAYMQNGYIEVAEQYYRDQIAINNRVNEMGRRQAETLFTYYDFSAIYAFFGEADKALENLKLFKHRQYIPFNIIHYLNTDPHFDKIRDNPEFQQIVHEVEAKYQAEHERVRQWLEENDML